MYKALLLPGCGQGILAKKSYQWPYLHYSNKIKKSSSVIEDQLKMSFLML
jgi:hypothetical protein